jgi:hypothetical protein
MKDVLSGVYRHYTGLIVFVIGVARHSETEEKFVIYIPLGAKAGPRLTIRPLEMFFSDIEVSGKKQKRFEYIGSEMPGELARDYENMHCWGRPGSE